MWVKADTDSREIIVVVPENVVKCPIMYMWASYTTPGHITEELYFLLQRNIPIRVQSLSPHKSQEMETAYMPRMMNGQWECGT